MNNSKLGRIKAQTPVSILIHGGNRTGYLIAKTLTEQGCHVIIIDNFNSQTSSYISDLKKSGSVDFFEFKGLDSMFKNLKRFDYLFYLLNNALEKKDFESKEFLKETGYLENCLKNSKSHNAKAALVTSLSLNRELSNRINNEKLASPSPYSNIELQKYCETLAAEYKDKTDINIRILRLGTIIGKGIERIDNEIIHNLLKDATQKDQIVIKGEGLDIHNVINENDATYGILKLTFSEKTKGEVITLANRNNYTTLSIAYKLLELNTEAQSIKFVENPDNKFVIQDLYVPAPHASKYGWSQQVTLETSLVEQLQSYYDDINKTWDVKEKPGIKNIEKNVRTTKTRLGKIFEKILLPFKKINWGKKKEINWNNIWRVGVISILTLLLTYFVIYPIIGTAIGVAIIASNAKGLSDSVITLDQEETTKKIQVIDRNLERVSNSIGNIGWAFKLVGQEDLFNNTTQLILGTQYAIDGAQDLMIAVSPLSEYIQDFQPALDFQTTTTSTTREYREYLNLMESNQYKVDDASYKISLASEIINRTTTNKFPVFAQNQISNIKDLIKTLEDGTETYKQVGKFLPNLLGVDERKRYLVLLQNESEIRSTGGWLTSYGVVGIEGGQVRELFVDDIYNADGTLRVQAKTFEAPDSMKNALGLDTWSFSLVNWYPDLPETLVSAEPFIDALGEGDDLDGIITIDISFVQKLLDKWGGIEVPGEAEIITSDNLYAKIFEMHEEFTPGSTQKTTFLADLANAIIQKVLSMNISDLFGISSVFEESLDEKHLQATFKNSDAYNFFNEKNWAGSLDSRYNDAPTSIDWNWGGNKANLYLTKNYNLNVDIKDENTIDFTYTISVENTSTSTTYPEGDYINYQRIYIPSSAEVLSVNGMENNEFSTYKESGFKVIGGWFNVPIQTIKTLEISYRVSNILEKDGQNIFLELNLFKQAGEKQNAYKLDIEYPSTWNVEDSSTLNSISNQLTSRFEFNTDKEFDIQWRISD